MEVKEILGSDFYNNLPDRDKQIYENYFVDVAKSPFRPLNREEKEIFSHAVYRAVAAVPSFRDALALLRPFVDVTCETAYVDQHARNGLSYWFFWYTKDVYERATILLHESMHLLYNHFSRAEIMGIRGKNMLYSSDLEINSVIKKIPRADISHGISPANFDFPELKTMEIYSNMLSELSLNNQKEKGSKLQFTSPIIPNGNKVESFNSVSGIEAGVINSPNQNGLTLFDELFIAQMYGGSVPPPENEANGEDGDKTDLSENYSEGDPSEKGRPSSGGSKGSSDEGSSGEGGAGKSTNSGSSASNKSLDNGKTGDKNPERDSSGDNLCKKEISNAEEKIKDIHRKKNSSQSSEIEAPDGVKECDEATEERSENADEAGIEKVSSSEQTIAKKNTLERVIEDSTSRNAGNEQMNDFLRISMNLMSPPKADWRKIFKNVMASVYGAMIIGHSHSSLTRINKRYSQGRILLPGTVDFTPKAMLGFDTSGSMGNKDYQAGLSEIEAIMKTVLRGRDTLSVFPVDVTVKDIQTVRSVKNITFSGGGGTDMSVAFQYVNEIPKKKRPSIFILVTDGGTNWESIADRLAESRGYKSVILVTDKGCYNAVPERVRRLAIVIDIS